MIEARQTDDVSSLDRQYRECLERYERGAARWKRHHQRTWLASTLLTWFTLLLAISGQTLASEGGRADVVLRILIPLLSTAVTLLTLYQLVFNPQQRWLGYRAAVQRLWNACMRYRARLTPFDGGRAEMVLADRLKQIRAPDEGQKRRTLREWLRYIPETYVLPAVPPERYPHLPEQGLQPPLDEDAAGYVDGRLRSQRQWYLREARRCRCWYVLLLGLVGLISTFDAVWVALHERTFWLVAGTTALTLMLFALRDFLNCGPLWTQYRQTAQDLEEIEKGFGARARPFDALSARKRLQRLVEQVERTLATEFDYWFAVQQQQPPKEQRAPLSAEGYEPRPIDTGGAELPAALRELCELLARNAHDLWARQRRAEGWRCGPERSDALQENPCLVPFEELPEDEKEYDRMGVRDTLRAILALQYRIEKSQDAGAPGRDLIAGAVESRSDGEMQRRGREAVESEVAPGDEKQGSPQ